MSLKNYPDRVSIAWDINSSIEIIAMLLAILIAAETFNPPMYTNYEQSYVNSAADKICGIVSGWDRPERKEVAIFTFDGGITRSR